VKRIQKQTQMGTGGKSNDRTQKKNSEERWRTPNLKNKTACSPQKPGKGIEAGVTPTKINSRRKALDQNPGGH